MKCLMIVAHGSRKQASTDEVFALAEKVKCLNVPFDHVCVAFLEFAQPCISVSFEQCFDPKGQDYDEVVVLPYFLSQGNHVAKDVPEALAQARLQWPSKKSPY
jgi:sirohydrochlorin ferrochelatase